MAIVVGRWLRGNGWPAMKARGPQFDLRLKKAEGACNPRTGEVVTEGPPSFLTSQSSRLETSGFSKTPAISKTKVESNCNTPNTNLHTHT